MTQPAQPPASESGRRVSNALATSFLAVALYILLLALTTPLYIGDTLMYAQNAADYIQGGGRLWEFGHLLWRPWGYLGWMLAGGAFARWFGDTPFDTIVRIFFISNHIAGLVCVFLLFRLLVRLVDPKVALLVTLAFGCTNPMINYSQSGSSYTPGLMFLLLACWLAVRSLERPAQSTLYACLSGAALAFAAGCWFPFAFAGLGVLAIFRHWPPEPDSGVNRDWIRPALWFLLVLAALFSAMAAVGGWFAGAHTPNEFKDWVVRSGHGWAQKLNAIRIATGWPRGFFDLGDETIELKRLLFRDPYNPPSVAALASLAPKLALVYAATLALLAGLWPRARRSLAVIALSALLPVVGFAVFIFEPSSQERYMPAFPFLFLAVAVLTASGPRWISITLQIFAGALIALNLWSVVKGRSSYEPTLERKQNLERQIESRATAFVLNVGEDVYRIPGFRPLDLRFKLKNYRYVEIAPLASSVGPVWRREFARNALAAWERGEEVWITGHARAAKPDPSWRWVEGDDPNLKWADFPAFFAPFTYDRDSGGDSFYRLAQTPDNRRLLEQIASR
jgi:hypothetical protein